MPSHHEYQSYRGHNLTVEMDAPDGHVLQVWIAGFTSSVVSVQKAKERIDEALEQSVEMPPLPEQNKEQPRRPRMRR